MKNIKYLLLILLIPITARAFELSCPQGPFNYQESFECVIKGDNSNNYDEFSGSITLSEDSIVCSYEEPINGFEIVHGDDDSSFSYKGISTSEELVKIKCEVTKKAESTDKVQLMVPNLKYHIYDSNMDAKNEVLRSGYVLISQYQEDPSQKPVEKPRNTSDASVRLKLISDENLDFTFSSFKTIYDIIVLFDVNKLNLNIVPNNELATYRIEGSQNLEIGDNTIDIYVTSPDGSKELCYTLNIKRLKRGEEIYYPEKDSSLKSLTIEGFSINFESIILDYNIHLKYDQDEINVKGVPTNDNAKVSVSKTAELNNGDTVEVVVTSEDGSSKTTYMINITKDSPPKDYRKTIYIGSFVVAISIVILIILKTNRSNKNNPLLRKKKTEEPKEDKKEETTDKKVEEKVEDTNAETPVVEEQVNEITKGIDTSGDVNTIDLNTTVTPVETTTPVVDENFNKVTSNINTLDLSNAQLPSELTPTVIPNGEAINQDNNQQ